MSKFHPFHLVSLSPWPILSSISILEFLLGGYLSIISEVGKSLLLIGAISLTVSTVLWWRDVIRESTFEGKHTSNVQKGLKIGALMFILSEVMFFFSFFFSYFFLSLSPDVELGQTWPPTGVLLVSYASVPLGTTMILLLSGVSLTLSHNALLSSDSKMAKLGLEITIVLALFFLFFQFGEYEEMSFTMADSCFGSLFYLMTGFHGIHVIVGSIFLMTVLVLMNLSYLSNTHHFSFEFASWYWHFVDVVWLFLFVIVYWWGS